MIVPGIDMGALWTDDASAPPPVVGEIERGGGTSRRRRDSVLGLLLAWLALHPLYLYWS